MKLLDRATILGVDHRKVERIDVKEWGGAVLLRELSAAEAMAYQKSLQGEDGKINVDHMHAKLVALSVVDESGQRLFGDDDIDAVAREPLRILRLLFDAAKKLNRMDDDAVKDAEKNSAAAPGGGDSTG